MAKVKFGALVQDARGKLAGNVFSRNRYGSYTRAKTSPVQPGTARQLAQRAIFTTCAQGWRDLTDAQRAQWHTWAANHPVTDVFGDSQIVQGNSCYSWVNANRLTLGLAVTPTPPADVQADLGPPVTSVTVDGIAGTITVTLAAVADAADLYQVWSTRGLSTGTTFAGQELRLAFSGAPGAVNTWTVTPTDFNPLLAFAAGQKVIVHVARFSAEGV